MLNLPQVTLCCVDGKNHAMALRALEHSRRDIRFAHTVFLTDAVPSGMTVSPGIDVIPVGPIKSHEAYSRIVLKELLPHIATTHVLLTQWDGYVVQPDAWTDSFLDCDYIGAPWPDGRGGFAVGNGGFSLRSRRLLDVLRSDSFPLLTDAEDVTICSYLRPRLESHFGIRFGEVPLAKRFSFEIDASDVIYGKSTFGFHGVFNFFLVESDQEIAAIVAMMSDAIAGLDMTILLLRNLLKFERFESAFVLGRRILHTNPEHEEAADAVVRARYALDSVRAQRRQWYPGRLGARILRKVSHPAK